MFLESSNNIQTKEDMHFLISAKAAEVSGGGNNMGKILYRHSFDEIISMKNLLSAWQEFLKGKRSRVDVQEFERHLMHNLFSLHKQLIEFTYRHGKYTAFIISDPKTRSIHKASVADRVLHRAVYRKLNPFFDRTFISDSFSCRVGKGSHKALYRFHNFSRRVSYNHHKTVWVLKCDIHKFFASIDQKILLQILDKQIIDKRIIWLLEIILKSFSAESARIGLPLGNLTSQLFANVYMNKFDQFVKHCLSEKFYIRYADDFVFFCRDRTYILNAFPFVTRFLWQELHLRFHPQKIDLCTVASGVDFLGWVHFTDHRVLRTSTRRRMLKALCNETTEATRASYRGLLKHGNAYTLSTIC